VLIACSREQFVCRQELLFVAFLVGIVHLAALTPSLQRRVGLHREPVATDVRRRELEGSPDVVAPGAIHFGRQCEDKVERPVVESGVAQCLDGTRRLRGVVGAVHPAKDVVVEALHTQRHARNASRAPFGGRGRGDVFRIRLDRDLRAWGRHKSSSHEIEHALHTVGTKA